MPVNYKDYLKLDQLLSLQEPESSPPEHDEMLFIIIHQVYELWFKIIMQEFEKIKNDFSNGDLFSAIASFQRARTVMKTLVGQLDILETMTPRSFNQFRSYLDTASGFQSVQFRELEFVLGYKRPQTLKFYDHDPEGKQRLEARLEERSVIDHFLDFLETRGATITEERRNKPVTESSSPDRDVQDAIQKIYETQPDARILFELMTDFDEGMQEWRYRHVKMVERTIGNKQGTGGSLGVEFLKKSLFQPAFADLWEIRHRF